MPAMPRFLALLMAVVIILLGVMTCLPLIREKAAQKRVQLQLQEDLLAEQMRTRDIESRIVAVKTDRPTVERLAREKFGLARTGEVVFKFRGDLASATAPAAPSAPPPASAPPGTRSPVTGRRP